MPPVAHCNGQNSRLAWLQILSRKRRLADLLQSGFDLRWCEWDLAEARAGGVKDRVGNSPCDGVMESSPAPVDAREFSMYFPRSQDELLCLQKLDL